MPKKQIFLIARIFIPLLIFTFTSKAQNSRLVNVKEYGAIGDGVHDDTKNIQSAFDAAIFRGGTVYFPKGEYLISNNLYLYYKSDISVTLKGVKGAILFPTNLRYYIYCNNGGADVKPFGSLAIENLKIDGSRLPHPQSFYFDKPSCAYGVFTTNLKNVSITNSEFSNIYGSAIWLVLLKNINDTSLQTVVKVEKNKIINCWGLNPTKDYYDKKDSSKTAYDNYGDGIAIWGYRNTVIDSNYVYNDISKTRHLGRGGIVLENDAGNTRITNNTIHGYDRNIHIESDKGGHYIYNNSLSGSDVGIYFWLNNNWRNNPTTIKNNTFSYIGEIEKYHLKTIVGNRKYIMLTGKATSTYQGIIIENNIFKNSRNGDIIQYPRNLNVIQRNNHIN